MKNPVPPVRRFADRALGTIPGRVVRKFVEDNGPSQATLIAWNLLQSVFPIALALATVLSLALGSTGLQSEKVLATLAAVLPNEAGQGQILSSLAHVHTKTGLLAVLALAGFLWSASNLFGALEQAFDVIYHVPVRNFAIQKLMAVVMMLLLAVLATVAVASSSLLPLLDRLTGVLAVPNGASAVAVQFVIGSLSGFVLFFAIYYVVPNRRLDPRQVWPGALFAGVAFEVLTLVFPLYLVVAGPGMDQYGKTFAFLFVLLTFFYFVGLVVMVGVELNSVLYPVPIPQPDRVGAIAPAATGPGQPAPEIEARDEKRAAATAQSTAVAIATEAPGRRRRPGRLRRLLRLGPSKRAASS